MPFYTPQESSNPTVIEPQSKFESNENKNFQNSFIGESHEAPQFMVYKVIKTGYRIGFCSTSKILKSIFMIHNETVNIWTHLLGAIGFIALIVLILAEVVSLETALYHKEVSLLADTMHLSESQEGALSLSRLQNSDQTSSVSSSHQVSVAPLIICLICAALCLLCSATFHLFYPLSKQVFNVALSLDFAGISFNLAGSVIPAVYYGMYCTPQIALMYLTSIVTLSIIVFGLSFTQKFKAKSNGSYRAKIFLGFSVFFFAPIIHLTVRQMLSLNDADPFEFGASLKYYQCAVAMYVIGTAIYALRCPERQCPRKYDYCGQSHHTWHVLVVAGMIFTYMGALSNYQMRKGSQCPI